jgi:hypothetical protein
VKDADCNDKLACVDRVCVDLCGKSEPCGDNAVCSVLNTLPVRTMTCVCLEGYEGDARRGCTPVKTCPPGRGLMINEYDECVCPPGQAFDENGICIPCR